MKKMKRDSLYLVTWQDHYSTQGWFSKGTDFSVGKKLLCRTTGFFIGEDEDHVMLAQTDNDYSYGDIMTIMKAGVTKVEKLK